MKIIIAIIATIFITSCSQEKIEEFSFRKSLEVKLVDLCEEEKDCIKAVKSQTKPCLEKNNWRQYYENQDDEAEVKRFLIAFYACIVDTDGYPFFEPNI